jgi:hypothetical protein
MWGGWRRDGPTLARWGLAAVLLCPFDRRAHDGWACGPSRCATVPKSCFVLKPMNRMLEACSEYALDPHDEPAEPAG